MKKVSISWSIKQMKRMYDNGKISFDYPIQRAGNQWDLLQKSLLIHSLADDYPVPPLYAIVEDDIYYILDGKQRMTTIFGFLNREFVLHEDTPSAHIDIEDKSFILSERLFEELDEAVQDQILSQSQLLYKMENTKDEEIEELFYRLNNGTPLTKQQKAKAKMGTEWANEFQRINSHPFMSEVANFTEAQLKKADDETAILQTMMLLDENHELKSISSNHVFDYTETFKEDRENKLALVDELINTFEYLTEALEKKEKVMLKKIHFPMTVITALKALEQNIHPSEFSDWLDSFKQSLKGDGDIQTNYKEFSGAGSVKRDRTLGRLEEMDKHFKAYFENKTFADTNLIKGLEKEEEEQE